MAKSKNGAKSVLDVSEGSKGTAAADPVLVVTREGEIVGTRIDGNRPARTHNGAESVEIELKDTRSPAEIEADLDRTRAHLSATLDELSERLTPRELARRGGQRIKAQFVEPESGKVKRGPVAAAVGGVGLAVGAVIGVFKLRSRSS